MILMIIFYGAAGLYALFTLGTFLRYFAENNQIHHSGPREDGVLSPYQPNISRPIK